MAFERIPSGYPGVDEVFDYIRMGDNVVWQVSTLDEYRLFAEAFADQARQGRAQHGIHALHPPRAPAQRAAGSEDVRVRPHDMGFEPFTVAIYNRITEEGPGTFYVFDCLSELQSAWYTDQMMAQLLPRHLPLPLRAGDRGVLPAAALAPLLRLRRAHPGHHPAAHRRLHLGQQCVHPHAQGPGREGNNDLHPLTSAARRALPPAGRRRRVSRYYRCSTTYPTHTQDQNSTATTASSPGQARVRPRPLPRRDGAHDTREHDVQGPARAEAHPPDVRRQGLLLRARPHDWLRLHRRQGLRHALGAQDSRGVPARVPRPRRAARQLLYRLRRLLHLPRQQQLLEAAHRAAHARRLFHQRRPSCARPCSTASSRRRYASSSRPCWPITARAP